MDTWGITDGNEVDIPVSKCRSGKIYENEYGYIQGVVSLIELNRPNMSVIAASRHPKDYLVVNTDSKNLRCDTVSSGHLVVRANRLVVVYPVLRNPGKRRGRALAIQGPLTGVLFSICEA